MIRELSARARSHSLRAIEYVEAWPQTSYPIRMFTLVPLALALATLKLLEEGGEDVLSPGRNPKVSRSELQEIWQLASVAAYDDDSLKAFLLQLGTNRVRP